MDGRKVVLSGLTLACLLASGCVTVPHRGETTHKATTLVAFADMQAAGGFKGNVDDQTRAQFQHEARLAYLEAIKVDPRHLPAYLGLARLHKAQGDFVAALGVYQQALELEGRNAGLWHEVGMTQCKLKKYDDAIASLKRALEFDPNNPKYKMALGGAMVLGGKPEVGFQVIASLKGEARAHVDLAKIYDAQGMTELAERHVAEAYRLDPNALNPAVPSHAKPLPLQDLPQSSDVVRTTYQLPGSSAAGVAPSANLLDPASVPAAPPTIHNGVPAPQPAAAPSQAPPVLSIRSR
ncbi:MAG: tetratricopeptide repeat protein [Gemmataceae bacterium]